MNCRCLAVISALTAMLLGGKVLAADLLNEDAVTYMVVIEDESGSREILVLPWEKLLDICQRCQISKEDAGPIPLEPSDTIIIQNGELSVSG